MDGTYTELVEALKEVRGMSVADQYDANRHLEQIKAADVVFATQRWGRTRDRLDAEYDDIAADVIDVKEMLLAIEKAAKRPDTDMAEVARAYADTVQVASGLSARIAAYTAAAEELNAIIDDPQPHVDAFRRKWAAGSPSNADAFLHHVWWG